MVRSILPRKFPRSPSARRMLLLAGLAYAGLTHAALADPYRLAGGDQIRLIAPEANYLTGIYRLGDDGAAAIPIGAPVDLDGLTVTEAEEAIRATLAKTLVEPTVSVELAEMRPFFILGDVNKAGPYPGQFRLTVMKAVAIAGGFKGQSDTYVATVTGIRASESLHVARRELLVARIVHARLRAELVDAATFDPGSLAPTEGDDPELPDIVNREREIFEVRKDGLKRELDLLAKEAIIRKDEIAALTARIDATAEQMESLKTEIANTEELVEKKLELRHRIFQLRREESQVLSTNLQTAVLLNQARQARNQLEIQTVNITRDRKLEVLDQIQKVRATISRLSNQLSADSAVILESEDSTSIPFGEHVATSYRIVREDGRVLDDIRNETEIVLPGDVVEVRRRLVGVAQN